MSECELECVCESACGEIVLCVRSYALLVQEECSSVIRSGFLARAASATAEGECPWGPEEPLRRIMK